MSLRNQKQERLPQAPRAPLPELAEFLAPLRVHFTQGPSAETLRQYLPGLLSEHPNKNCDTLAEVVPETNQQQFNHLLTDMVWDETALNHQRIARMRTLPSEGDGVLIFEDTGFEKQGRHSVGVAHQYTGTAGKLTNCQVTVNCHYAERTLAWPVATRLDFVAQFTNVTPTVTIGLCPNLPLSFVIGSVIGANTIAPWLIVAASPCGLMNTRSQHGVTRNQPRGRARPVSMRISRLNAPWSLNPFITSVCAPRRASSPR
jgi:hypothetical protein